MEEKMAHSGMGIMRLQSLRQIQQEKQLQVGVIDSWPPSVNPPKVCTVWHCFQSPSFLPWPFILTLSLWWKRCHVGDSASCCLCVLVGGHRLFFSGEWCLTHPSVALSCPVDSCYSLWRSQSFGPDEQGLIHLTGRFLPTSNHCRDKGRR